MDKKFQYTQVVSNFDSAYNIPPPIAPYSTTYIPMYSSTSFDPFSNRPPSPLFRRCVSPPPRRPLLTETGPKFNFDLYKMDENNNQYTGYTSPSYRSLSPSSPRIVHHYPVHSPSSSPGSRSGSLSKLKQINDELYSTLARSERNDPSAAAAPHYHIHHYPLSQQSHPKHRPRSASEERRPPFEFQVPPQSSNPHKARVTYKIHVPRHHRHGKSSHRASRSDEFSSDEPVVIDLYPTRDGGFVREDPDNQSPWLVSGTSLQHSSYSDPRTSSQPSRRPKDAYYEDKPIQSYHRSNPAPRQSPTTVSRRRPDSAILRASDQFYESHGSFSDAAPVWRSTDSATPSRMQRRTWRPTSKTISRTPPKHFSSNLHPDYDSSTRRRVIDEIESDRMSQRETSDRVQIRNDDPKLRKRIQGAESKVKTTWQPTVTGIRQPKPSEFDDLTGKPVLDETESEPISQRKSSDRSKIRRGDPKLKKRVQDAESKVKTTWKPTANDLPGSPVIDTKPLVPVPRKERTPSTPPKPKAESKPTGPPTTTNTGRSSLGDESTPRNQNDTQENNASVEDLFDNESHASESPRPPPIERKPSVELPKTIVPKPDQGTKSTIKNGVLVHGNDTPKRDQTFSSTSEVHENNKTTLDAKPKPSTKDNESVADDDEDDRDENDEEVARSMDISKWLGDASKAILAPSKKGSPSPSPQPPLVKPKPNSLPRRREQPPSPPADEDLYKPPFGPKKSNPPPAPTTTTTTTGATEEVDDFFA